MFDLIEQTYYQTCKHINLSNIIFILFYPEQESFLKDLSTSFNYIYDNEIILKLNIQDNFIKHFANYNYDETINIINNKNKININEIELINIIEKNFIKRSYYDIDLFKSICCFGPSVTGQTYSYVNYLIKNKNIEICHKKGYSGCHINQAIWLVNDVLDINPKPKICFIEFITSIYKCSSEYLWVYLSIIIKKLLDNNIIPIFLYLYKTDVDNFLDFINIYEDIAKYYNISSIFLYKIIQSLNIDTRLILKDSCHTVYAGSELYGSIIEKIIFQYFINDNIPILNNKIELILNNDIYNKYNNIKILNLDKLIDCSNMEHVIFNEKKYYKIDNEIILNITERNLKSLIAINILYYINNGYIYINNNKIQTWDRNSYYRRYGFCNLNIKSDNSLIIKTSQELFDTSSCKY
jgi:hypothetical protein